MQTITVITINRNNAEGLEKTINSVVSQVDKNFEFVIVDGSSSDGSQDVVKKYKEFLTDLQNVIFVSEPDTGIYNAMNKAISMSSGEYLLFMNSGDCFYSGDVIQKFRQMHYTADIVAGQEWYSIINRLYIPPKEEELTYDFFTRDSIMHQATFIRKNLFDSDKVGLYNESYKIVSDWEWFIKALIVYNYSYMTSDIIVCLYDNQGISCQSNYVGLQNAERADVFSKVLPRVAPMSAELKSLREVDKTFRFLLNGKCGFIVKFLLWLKKLKKS